MEKSNALKEKKDWKIEKYYLHYFFRSSIFIDCDQKQQFQNLL